MGFLSNLIGGKTKTVPTSSSTSLATQRSSSGSLNFGSSSSFGRSGSAVFEPDVFRAMFGGASSAAGRAAELVPELQGRASTLFNTGGRFLEELEGPLSSEDRLAEAGLEDEQIGMLGQDLGRFFEEELNPQITGRGVAAGTLGGARGEIARGTAVRGLGEEFIRGATSIRAQGQQRRDALSGMIDSLRTGRTTAGLSALPGLFGLAEAGVGAELSPFLALSQIIGAPTVLSSSESGSQSSELGRAFSEMTGEQRSSSSGSTVTRGPGLLDVGNMLAGFV